VTTAEAITARKMHRTLEPYHGVVYFSREAFAADAELGITDRQMGYFASRAAAMGAVPAEVVIATFFNFSPDLVRRSIPAAWSLASPSELLAARLQGIDGTLRRILGAEIDAPDMVEAAALATTAAEDPPPPPLPAELDLIA
jgi:hypothetical protein